MFKKINLMIIILCILQYNICKAIDINQTTLTKKLFSDSTPFINEVDDNYEIFILNLLERILSKRKVLLANSYWISWKIFFLALIPLSVGINNLVLAVNNDITPSLILLTQFTVPLNIYNAFNILNKTRVIYKDGLKKNINNCKKNIPNSILLLLNGAISIYLAYLSALIDSETSADAYRWIFSSFTNSPDILTGSYYTGYILKLGFCILLNSVFFFNLIDEIKDSTGINWCLRIDKNFAANKQKLIYSKHINTLRAIIYNNCYIDPIDKIENHLIKHQLNNILDIANLQFYCINKDYITSKKFNVFVNITKLCCISTMAVFCSEAFKKIFASKLLLKNFIEDFANHTTNGSYELPLKNHSVFYCNNINDCILRADFNKVDVNANQIDYLLSADKTAIIANVLKGIAISTNTAIILIKLYRYGYMTIQYRIFRQSIIDGAIKKENIIPIIASATLLLSGYYYMQNIYNITPVAEKADDLLNNAGKQSFISAKSAVILSISVIGLTFSKGTLFLIDMSRYFMHVIKKSFN
jgi:hypothetical protein